MLLARWSRPSSRSPARLWPRGPTLEGVLGSGGQTPPEGDLEKGNAYWDTPRARRMDLLSVPPSEAQAETKRGCWSYARGCTRRDVRTGRRHSRGRFQSNPGG